MSVSKDDVVAGRESGRFAVFFVSGFEQEPGLAAHHPAASAFADVLRADRLDRAEQRFQVGVEDGVFFAYQGEVGKAGFLQRVADFRRFAEGQRMAVVVDAGKGFAQFVKSVRPERTQRQPAAGSQNACGFGENGVRIAPLDGQARSLEVEAPVFEWQLLDVGGKAGIGRLAGDFKHGRREVDAGDMRFRPARAQQSRTVAGTAAGVEDVRQPGFAAVERFQLFEQAVADAALNDGGGVVGDGGAVNRFADA